MILQLTAKSTGVRVCTFQIILAALSLRCLLSLRSAAFGYLADNLMGVGPGPRPNPDPEIPLVGGGEATSPLLPLLSPTSPIPVAPAPAEGVLWPGAKGEGAHYLLPCHAVLH